MFFTVLIMTIIILLVGLLVYWLFPLLAYKHHFCLFLLYAESPEEGMSYGGCCVNAGGKIQFITEGDPLF